MSEQDEAVADFLHPEYAGMRGTKARITILERQVKETQEALRALSWQEPDGTRHWGESAARGESDIAVNDCNCDEGRAILGESE